MKLCKRKTDGAMFRPSYPDGYDEVDSIVDCVRGTISFYLRGVQWKPRRWWQLRGRWIDTGEIWTPQSGEFDVVDV